MSIPAPRLLSRVTTAKLGLLFIAKKISTEEGRARRSVFVFYLEDLCVIDVERGTVFGGQGFGA
jgi:hypothetical protein